MDTSMGLSSIASLSLGLSMSMTCTQQHQFKPQHRQFYSKRASVCSASFAIRPTTLPRMPSSASFHVAADVTSSTTTHSTPREATTQVEVHPSSQGTQSDKNYRHKTDEADKKTYQEEEPLTKTFQRPLSEVNNNNNNNSSSSNSSSNNNNSSSNNNGTSNNSKKNPEQSCKRFTQVFKRQDACAEDDKFPQQRRRESLQRSFFLSIDEEDESIRRESDGGGTEGGNDDEDDEEGGGDDCDGCDVRCKQPLIVENGSSPNVTNKINSPSCPLLQLTDDTN